MAKQTKTQKTYTRLKTANGNPYIHLMSKDDGIAEGAMSMFSREKIKSKYEQQLKQLEVRMNEVYKNPAKPDQDLFDFLDEIKADTQQAINESDVLSNMQIKTSGQTATFKVNAFDPNSKEAIVNEVESSFYQMSQYYGKPISNKDLFFRNAESELENLSTYLNFIDEIIKDTKLEFADDKIQKMVESFFIENRGKKMGGRIFKEALNEFLIKEEGKLIKDKGFLREGRELYEKYAIRLRAYQEVMKKVHKNTKMTAGSQQGGLLKGVSFYAATTISQIGGFMSEPLIRDAVIMANNGLMSSITSAVSGEKSVEIQGADLIPGLEKNFTKSKVDTRLVYKANSNAVSASLEVELPGASIKAFTPKATPHQEISVETGSTLGQIMARSYITGRQEEYYIANLIGNYRKAGAGIKKDQMVQMYSYINAANILNSLVGTMSEKDTAYFMILNKKVLTANEVIKSIINGESYMDNEALYGPNQTEIQKANKPIKPNLVRESARTKAADERSNMVYALLKSSHLKTKLQIGTHLLQMK